MTEAAAVAISTRTRVLQSREATQRSACLGLSGAGALHCPATSEMLKWESLRDRSPARMEDELGRWWRGSQFRSGGRVEPLTSVPRREPSQTEEARRPVSSGGGGSGRGLATDSDTAPAFGGDGESSTSGGFQSGWVSGEEQGIRDIAPPSGKVHQCAME